MTPQQFIAKWQAAQLTERSACQQHFLDLCELLGQPKPADVDSDGSWYTFEKGVRTTTDGQGFADVWMRGRFAWEYMGKRKDLKAAYQQLQKYREDLDNPPLLVDDFRVASSIRASASRNNSDFAVFTQCNEKNSETAEKSMSGRFPNESRPVAGGFTAIQSLLGRWDQGAKFRGNRLELPICLKIALSHFSAGQAASASNCIA